MYTSVPCYTLYSKELTLTRPYPVPETASENWHKCRVLPRLRKHGETGNMCTSWRLLVRKQPLFCKMDQAISVSFTFIWQPQVSRYTAKREEFHIGRKKGTICLQRFPSQMPQKHLSQLVIHYVPCCLNSKTPLIAKCTTKLMRAFQNKRNTTLYTHINYKLYY